MNCPFCTGRIVQINSKFCPECGHSLAGVELKPAVGRRARGNGYGSAVLKPNGTYMARATICIDDGSDKLVRREKTKSGFSTKEEALETAIQLRKQLELKYPIYPNT